MKNIENSKNLVKGFLKKFVVLLFMLIMIIPSVDAKTFSKKECKAYAYKKVIKHYHWSLKDYDNLIKLWNYESGWNAKSYNKRTGACGIPQATPCSKMKKYGNDYKTNCKVQIRWGLKYIYGRYKTPTKAWKHVKKTGWY